MPDCRKGREENPTVEVGHCSRGPAPACNAGLQPAVARILNPLAAWTFHALPNIIRRYGRVETGATSWRRGMAATRRHRWEGFPAPCPALWRGDIWSPPALPNCGDRNVAARRFRAMTCGSRSLNPPSSPISVGADVRRLGPFVQGAGWAAPASLRRLLQSVGTLIGW